MSVCKIDGVKVLALVASFVVWLVLMAGDVMGIAVFHVFMPLRHMIIGCWIGIGIGEHIEKRRELERLIDMLEAKDKASRRDS